MVSWRVVLFAPSLFFFFLRLVFFRSQSMSYRAYERGDMLSCPADGDEGRVSTDVFWSARASRRRRRRRRKEKEDVAKGRSFSFRPFLFFLLCSLSPSLIPKLDTNERRATHVGRRREQKVSRSEWEWAMMPWRVVQAVLPAVLSSISLDVFLLGQSLFNFMWWHVSWAWIRTSMWT